MMPSSLLHFARKENKKVAISGSYFVRVIMHHTALGSICCCKKIKIYNLKSNFCGGAFYVAIRKT
jgi:hypothetical protein